MRKIKPGHGRQEQGAGAGPFPGGVQLLAVVCVAFLAFLPILHGEFLDWDDDFNFLNNLNYRGLGPRQLYWMFTTFLGGPYQPLTWLSCGLDYVLWGMNAARYHLTNVLLHSLNAGLFYAAGLRLLRLARPEPAEEKDLRWAAAFAALIFAAHPLRVESVAWITERRDVLSGAFYLAALLFYLRAAAEPALRVRRLRQALALYCAALLSKAIGVGFAFVLLALDVYPLRRLPASPKTWLAPESRPVLLEKLPFLAAGLLAGFVGLFGQYNSAATFQLSEFGPAQRLAQAAYGTVFYLWKTLLPSGLLPIYEVPASFDPYGWPFLLCGAAVIAAAALIYKFRARWPGLVTAAAAYLAFLAPVLGFVKMGSHFAADRYSYLACGGWALLAGGLLARWLAAGRGARALAVPAAVLLVALSARLTWTQTARWKNSETLWTYTVPLAPGSSLAYNNLGDVYFRQRRNAEAAVAYARALALRPDYAFVSYNLANALAGLKSWDQAERQYRETLRIKPDFPAARGNYGNLLADQGRYAEAEAQYNEALRLEPRNGDVRCGLAEVYLRRGLLEEAQVNYEQALRDKPTLYSAASNLALTLYRLKKWDQAEPWFLAAIRLAPDRAIAHDNYGNFLLDFNRFGEAVAQYSEALRLDNTRPETYNNIGAALFRMGRAEEAIPYFQRALEINPGMAMARQSLAAALKLKGKKP
ncbi:MAG TPA: tetratricopeptide repeat protein [Elusimicrobiales bacterium]|nr:tetratricopeptide repeat protein [Elusimicrobiales bacterium]